MKKLIIMVTAASLLTGCAFISETTEQVAEKASEYVNEYCTRPVFEREQVRAWFNSAIEPHVIYLQCEGDAQPDLKTRGYELRNQ